MPRARRRRLQRQRRLHGRFAYVGFHVMEPRYDKHHMVIFTDVREGHVWAANAACLDVLKAHGHEPFHQVGNRNEPGEHGWETWRRDTTTAEMQALLPEIYRVYRTNLAMW